MDLRGCSEEVVDDLLVKDARDAFGLTSVPSLSFEASFSRFSVAELELLKSKAVPGVLGVLPDEPNDAKAPDPNPKADEAPVVGEATLVVVTGAMPLNGFDLLLKDPSPPKRFVGWYGREDSDLVFSLVPLFVDRDSLLELWSSKLSQLLQIVDSCSCLLGATLPQIVHEEPKTFYQELEEAGDSRRMLHTVSGKNVGIAANQRRRAGFGNDVSLGQSERRMIWWSVVYRLQFV